MNLGRPVIPSLDSVKAWHALLLVVASPLRHIHLAMLAPTSALLAIQLQARPVRAHLDFSVLMALMTNLHTLLVLVTQLNVLRERAVTIVPRLLNTAIKTKVSAKICLALMQPRYLIAPNQ